MIRNKNAFQWDAYRLFVDRIPTCTGQGGCLPGGWGCLPGGEGCLPLVPGDVADSPPVDRQTPVKT